MREQTWQWRAVLAGAPLVLGPPAFDWGLVALGASARQIAFAQLLTLLMAGLYCRRTVRRMDGRRQVARDKEIKNRLLERAAQRVRRQDQPPSG